MFLIRGMWKLTKWTIKWSMISIIAAIFMGFMVGQFLPTEEEKLAAMTPQERVVYIAEKEAKKVAWAIEKAAESARKEEENKATIATLVEEVSKVPASKFNDNIIIYKKLVQLAPGNEQFKAKLAHYQNVAKMRKAEFAADAALVKARQEAARNLTINAFIICKESVLAQANYASKADFGWGSYEGHVSPETGDGRVGGTVELMNGFGAMIPQRFVCLVKNRMVSVAVLADN